jgi:hypothetical protein
MTSTYHTTVLVMVSDLSRLVVNIWFVGMDTDDGPSLSFDFILMELMFDSTVNVFELHEHWKYFLWWMLCTIMQTWYELE